MDISTKILLCGVLLAILGLVGFVTLRPLAKLLEKAHREDLSVDFPGPDEAAKAGKSDPSKNDVQAAIDELTRLATAPAGSKAKEPPGEPPTLARLDRAQVG